MILGEFQLVNTRFTLHTMQPSYHKLKINFLLWKSFMYLKRIEKKIHRKISFENAPLGNIFT